MPYRLITVSVRLKGAKTDTTLTLIPVGEKKSSRLRSIGTIPFTNLSKESQEKIERLKNDLHITILFPEPSG